MGAANYPLAGTNGSFNINNNLKRNHSNFGKMTYFTSGRDQNSLISVVGPGDLILTTNIPAEGPNGVIEYYKKFDDTSAATPHVAAIAALMLSKNARISPRNVRRIIERTAEELPAYTPNSNGWNTYVGHGIVNAFKAVQKTPRGFLLPFLWKITNQITT